MYTRGSAMLQKLNYVLTRLHNRRCEAIANRSTEEDDIEENGRLHIYLKINSILSATKKDSPYLPSQEFNSLVDSLKHYNNSYGFRLTILPQMVELSDLLLQQDPSGHINRVQLIQKMASGCTFPVHSQTG